MVHLSYPFSKRTRIIGFMFAKRTLGFQKMHPIPTHMF